MTTDQPSDKASGTSSQESANEDLSLVGQARKPKPKDTEEIIGMAHMKNDPGHTIVLDLYTQGKPHGMAHSEYSKTDQEYNNILKHLHGLIPGEYKPVPPWKENER